MSPSTQSSAPRIPFQRNPFTNQAAGSPWTDSPADVSLINNEPFQLLRRGLRQSRAGSDPISIVVTGEPGSGKTHLLSRLKRYLEQETDGDKAWYVYVRCDASARTLWRHLQGYLAGDLLSRAPGKAARHSRLAQLVREEPHRLEQTKHLGVLRALERLADGTHALVAAAWLRGEPMSESDLAALGIGIDKEDEDRNREEEAKHVIQALLRFLSPTTVVLCFDQVEALETYPGEQAGYHALGQMVSTLVSGDHRRLLLISCIVAAFEYNLDKLPNGADRDRWLQEKTNLARIEWDPAMELVKTRLDGAPALRLDRQRHMGDPLWPLDEAALRPLFAQTGRCLPRELIQTCRKEFDRQMGDVELGPKPSLKHFLQQEYGRYLAAARLEWRKEGGEKVLADCLPWLLQNSQMTVLDRGAGAGGYADLSVQNAAGSAALMFCYTGGNSFTSRMRKAIQEWHGKPELKVLSDPAIQPRPTSRGAEYLDELKSRGAHQIQPLPEALAALHAIRKLTTSARDGGLTLDGERVDETQAGKWILDNLEPALDQLRDELLIKPPEDPVKPKLQALLSRRKVLVAATAARELSLSDVEVASCARRYPMHFGLLEGPPVVLFEAVEGSAAEAANA